MFGFEMTISSILGVRKWPRGPKYEKQLILDILAVKKWPFQMCGWKCNSFNQNVCFWNIVVFTIRIVGGHVRIAHEIDIMLKSVISQ